MRFLIGLIFLPFYPIFKWILDRIDIIEKTNIDDHSILILKGKTNVKKIIKKT